MGGNVRFVRPLVSYKQFIPMNKGRNALGMEFAGFLPDRVWWPVAPPQDRYYLGGENDLRGFDVRTVTPYGYFPTVVQFALRDPDSPSAPVYRGIPRIRGAAVGMFQFRFKVWWSQAETRAWWETSSTALRLLAGGDCAVL